MIKIVGYSVVYGFAGVGVYYTYKNLADLRARANASETLPRKSNVTSMTAWAEGTLAEHKD